MNNIFFTARKKERLIRQLKEAVSPSPSLTIDEYTKVMRQAKKYKKDKQILYYYKKLVENEIKQKVMTDEMIKRWERFHKMVEGELDWWKNVIPKKAVEEMKRTMTASEIIHSLEVIKKRYERIIYKKEKFSKDNFSEVDKLITTGYKKTSAIKEIAEKYGYDFDSFKVQYYHRHNPKKWEK